MSRALSLVLPALLLPGLAGAAQSQPASTWSRDLPLGLEEAAIDLHIGLAGASAKGSGAWGANLTLALDADGVDEIEELALAAMLEGDCLASGLPGAVCGPAASSVAGSLADFNDAMIELVPVYAAWTVGSWGWVSALSGLYPMVGVHEYDDGAEETWSYVLNNNDGAAGQFAAAGLSLNGGGVTEGLACADVSGALINGGFVGAGVTADFVADRELACVGGVEGLVVAGTVGMAFGGAVVGEVE